MSVDDQITTDLTFGITPTWVLHADISDRATRLYGVLSRLADNDTGRSWPSRRTLAERLGCSADSIDRAKAELVTIGALTVEQRVREDGSYSTSLYTLRRIPPVRTGAEGGRSVAEGYPQDCGGDSREVADAELDLVEPDQEQVPVATRPRARFVEYDALVAVFGEPGTKAEAAFYAKTARALRDDGKTVDEITARGQVARGRWPECTVAVLANRWSTLAPRQAAPGSTLDDVAARDADNLRRQS